MSGGATMISANGGARISTGSGSKQDYGTPVEFLTAVEKRFGRIVVDLAAHRGNNKHPRYFAPAVFEEKVERGKTDLGALLAELSCRGADPDEARALAFEQWQRITGKGTIRIPNRDLEATALDAFAQDWATATADGIGWLNCEFSDIAPWAQKSGQGGDVTLLTPASVRSVWARTHVFGKADVYLLAHRLMFDGKNVFPKDCMLSHYHPGATGRMCVWDWKADQLVHDWRVTTTLHGLHIDEPGQRGLFG